MPKSLVVKTSEPCGAERRPEPVACPERSRGEGAAAGKLRSIEWQVCRVTQTSKHSIRQIEGEQSEFPKMASGGELLLVFPR